MITKLPFKTFQPKKNILSMSTGFFVVAIIFGLASTSDAFKLLGMPRFLASNLPSIASSVPGQEVTRTTPIIRDLLPITVDTNRELLTITDKNFSQNVLEAEGLSIVLFTR